MEENNELKSEIFNLTKETITVKKLLIFVKNIILKYFKETNDEIPNLGFSLSNKIIEYWF